MSTILYYSNYCNNSTKLLQTLSKSNIKNEIHFICIDKRSKENNKTFISLEDGTKIIMPDIITRVPALFLLKDGYKVIYGEDILKYFKPAAQEVNVRQIAQNNIEPSAFSFHSSGFSDIISDKYSFVDMDPDALTALGNGGMRQMHSYVDLNMNNQDKFECPEDEFSYKKSNKMTEGVTIEQLQQKRESELKGITANRPLL